MNAAQTLPENYALRWSFNMKSNVKAAFWLQVATIPLLIAAASGFSALAKLRGAAIFGDLKANAWLVIAILLGGMVFMITVHEVFHGIGFVIFGAHPKFGIGWGYAYAAAPDWFFMRTSYLIIALLPLIGISLIGAALIFFVPTSWVWSLVYMLIINASGAVGDIYIAMRIALEKGDILVRDLGDGFEVYGG